MVGSNRTTCITLNFDHLDAMVEAAVTQVGNMRGVIIEPTDEEWLRERVRDAVAITIRAMSASTHWQWGDPVHVAKNPPPFPSLFDNGEPSAKIEMFWVGERLWKVAQDPIDGMEGVPLEEASAHIEQFLQECIAKTAWLGAFGCQKQRRLAALA